MAVEDKAMYSEIDMELYKSLRSEAMGYVEKVPALWLQKFVLIGSAIAFLVAERGNFDGSGNLLVLSVIAIPIISVLLDVKIGEYGLHARIISKFIRKRFGASPLTAEWEATLWGDHDNDPAGVISLVKLRSLMTAVVTAVPTVILILLAGLALDQIKDTAPLFSALSVAASVLYVLGGLLMWYRIWPREKAR